MRNSLRRFFTLLVGLASTASAADAATLEQITAKGEIKVAVYRDFPPFSSSKDGVLSGIDVDIAKALGKKLGVTVAFKEQTPGESVNDDLRNAIWMGHYLDHQTADVMLHIPTDPALADLNPRVAIFAPYYREQIVVAGNPDSFNPSEGFEVFHKVLVGVETATMADMVLLTTDHGSYINNVHHFRTLAKAIDGMEKGEVAAVMGVRAELEGALGDRIKRFPISVMTLPPYGHTTWTLGLAVTKEDNATLTKALGDALGELVADGTVPKIFSAHGLEYVAP